MSHLWILYCIETHNFTHTHTHSFSMYVDTCREAERRWRKGRSWGKEDGTREGEHEVYIRSSYVTHLREIMKISTTHTEYIPIKL